MVARTDGALVEVREWLRVDIDTGRVSVCVFLLMRSVVKDGRPRCRDARFMLENHLGKIDDVH